MCVPFVALYLELHLRIPRCGFPSAYCVSVLGGVTRFQRVWLGEFGDWLWCVMCVAVCGA